MSTPGSFPVLVLLPPKNPPNNELLDEDGLVALREDCSFTLAGSGLLFSVPLKRENVGDLVATIFGGLSLDFAL